MPAPARFDLDRIGAGLPFAVALGPLGRALAGGAAVVQAPPGSGKTTLVPPAVAEHVGGSGRVVVTQPRRVAARAAARRLAHLVGEPVGRTVGFTVRGERRTGRDTRVEMVTPGVLLRRLVHDPALAGVAAVVLDEVHERSLETDLLVGMLAEVRQLRADLVVVAMSATVDAPRFAEVLGDTDPAPVVDCPAVLHPLTVDWAPYADLRQDARGVTRDFLDHVARVARSAHRAATSESSEVDALVFLPGVREVRQVAAALRQNGTGTEVLELHGQVPAREQDRATAGRGPGDPPRIVVSTALAESSLTVPGVRLVVDAGLAREPRRDAAREMSGLVTVPCSRASADQRAGRAARLGPGRAVRCYDQDTWRGMPAHVTPQVSTADLTDMALLLAVWGTPAGDGLPWVTPPPARAMADAVATLQELDAVDPEGAPTSFGRRLAGIPVDPRLGRGLLEGARLVGPRRAAEVVAALAAEHRRPDGDLEALLEELRSGTAAPAVTWRAEVDRLTRLVDQDGPSRTAPGLDDLPRHPVGLVVALAHPRRVARREGGQVLLASGTRAGLPPDSPARHHEWLAVADVARSEGRAADGTGAVVRLSAPIDRATAELAAHPLRGERMRAQLREGRVQARMVQALGDIELASTPVRPGGDGARQAVADALAAQGLSLLSWDAPALSLRRRLAVLHHHLGEPWPEVSDAALLQRLPEWLGPELVDLAGGTPVRQVALLEPVRRLLPWPQAARLDDLVPERLAVPSGGHPRIEYPEVDQPDGRPVVRVKLQECFGWADTPRLVDGRLPVLFHLLSPAQRPLAVTDDLASFWSGPYAQVRAEMRGRYPKHPWPENPWEAQATARTNRRRG